MKYFSWQIDLTRYFIKVIVIRFDYQIDDRLMIVIPSGFI